MVEWIEVSDDEYMSSNNETIKREFGYTPNGIKLYGQWVYRDSNDVFIDYSLYRINLFEKYNIKINIES